MRRSVPDRPQNRQGKIERFVPVARALFRMLMALHAAARIETPVWSGPACMPALQFVSFHKMWFSLPLAW